MTYIVQDAKNVLYNNFDTPLTSSGDSNEISFELDGGCPDADIILNVKDMEGTGTITFELKDYRSGSYVATGHQLALGAGANGIYVIPINNRIITGKKMKLSHTITAGTDADGVQVHAHLRPRI